MELLFAQAWRATHDSTVMSPAGLTFSRYDNAVPCGPRSPNSHGDRKAVHQNDDLVGAAPPTARVTSARHACPAATP